MRVRTNNEGFTVAELVVTLVVMTIFVSIFFNLFLAGQSQQIVITNRAAANDIAVSNLRKISSKNVVPGTTATCDATVGVGNVNDLTQNPNAPGSVIASNRPSTNPTWSAASMSAENIAGTGLPSGTIQELRIFYPQGCESYKPAKVVSRVEVNGEVIEHATFIY